jgi:hypothetical protein
VVGLVLIGLESRGNGLHFGFLLEVGDSSVDGLFFYGNLRLLEAKDSARSRTIPTMHPRAALFYVGVT